jgi:O-antigen/teichoic acid export membrane protein
MKYFEKKLNIPTTKILYVLINITVSGMGFLRSFVFIKYLDIYDLGLLTIFQTIIMLITMFQFGLINGGYRIIALNIDAKNKEVNNLLFSFFGLITIFLFIFWIGSLFIKMQLSHILLLMALIIGVLSLVVNWLTNTLIGRQALPQLNKINLISGIGALLLLPLSFFWGLSGAIIVLTAQPLIFIVCCMIRCTELRPTAFCFEYKLIKQILAYGFIPFLSGILTLVNIQIERWTIVKFLGTEELGNFYLVFLFSTVFVLIPTSLNNLFFPQCVRYYNTSNMSLFKSQLRKYSFILLLYLFIVITLSNLFLKGFVFLFVPKHIKNIKYVFLYMPGLLALCLCDPISLIFNSSVKLRPLLLAGFSSVVLNLILIFVIQKTMYLSLSFMAVIKSVINIYILIFYLSWVFLTRNKIFNQPNKDFIKS